MTVRGTAPSVPRVPSSLSSTRFSRAPNVVAHVFGGDVLLVPTAGKVADLRGIYVLNPTGAFVWDNLTEAQTAESLAQKVCDAFDVAPEDASRDVEELLDLLIRQGLLTRDTAPVADF